MTSEAETRKNIIDHRLEQAGWDVVDRSQVIEEFFVSGPSVADRPPSVPVLDQSATYAAREFSDFVLLGRNGKPIAVVEAKKSSKSAELGREQAKQYCYNIQARNAGD